MLLSQPRLVSSCDSVPFADSRLSGFYTVCVYLFSILSSGSLTQSSSGSNSSALFFLLYRPPSSPSLSPSLSSCWCLFSESCVFAVSFATISLHVTVSYSVLMSTKSIKTEYIWQKEHVKNHRSHTLAHCIRSFKKRRIHMLKCITDTLKELMKLHYTLYIFN